MSPRAKYVHASAQSDIYVTGHYSKRKHCTNKQIMKYVCLKSNDGEYMKKVKILKKFSLGRDGLKDPGKRLKLHFKHGNYILTN